MAANPLIVTTLVAIYVMKTLKIKTLNKNPPFIANKAHRAAYSALNFAYSHIFNIIAAN